MPCSARPATSTVIEGAVAQIILVTKNHATEKSKMGFLPHISEIFVHIGPAAAFARR